MKYLASLTGTDTFVDSTRAR